jgi:hypothetical protein
MDDKTRERYRLEILKGLAGGRILDNSETTALPNVDAFMYQFRDDKESGNSARGYGVELVRAMGDEGLLMIDTEGRNQWLMTTKGRTYLVKRLTTWTLW